MGQRDLLTSMTMDQDFPGKVSHCMTCFSLSHSVERSGGRNNNGQSWQRKNPRKKSKSGTCEKRDNEESTNSDSSVWVRYCLIQLFFFSVSSVRFRRRVLLATFTGVSLAFQGSNAAELQRTPSLSKALGQTKNLCRFQQGFSSFPDKMMMFLYSLGLLFSFSLPKDFFLFLISPYIRFSAKSFHVSRNFVKCAM